MSRWSVRVTETAERDLASAVLYIKEALANPTAATALVDAFEGCVAALSRSPEARPLVRDARLAGAGYRWVPVKGHMAFYTVDSGSREVTIERVLYGRTNWAAIL
ncbi:MAG: type II toxin-antitoxin system RelE/ParE family toxin [Atopobiaceae bacterium]|nr:type II toxin-antitoxin system RelE/ParE family toxin [Atopobiaceae bacterium]